MNKKIIAISLNGEFKFGSYEIKIIYEKKRVFIEPLSARAAILKHL
jgi:virulence-associated protein VagC